MGVQKVHKKSSPTAIYSVCGWYLDGKGKIGTHIDSEVTCKICLAGGRENYYKQRHGKN